MRMLYSLIDKIRANLVKLTGNFLIDDTFLAGEGVSDFAHYRADPSQPLARDFFVPDDIAPPPGVQTIDNFGDRT